MKSKLNTEAIGLIVVFVLLLLFSFYGHLGTEEGKKEEYVVEEIIEPGEIIPEEKEIGDFPALEDENVKEKEEVKVREGIKEEKVINKAVITINNLRFYPNNITIAPGTTVIWFNNDTAPHKVVSYDRAFYGTRMAPKDKYNFTFTQEGTYRYFDGVFPKIGRGIVTVKEEPLPITGGVVGVDLSKGEGSWRFALLVLLFAVMVLGLSHGIYSHHKI